MARILTPAQAAEHTGYSPETLKSWRYQSRGRLAVGQPMIGPRWVDGPSGKCRGYTLEALDEWLDAQEVGAA